MGRNVEKDKRERLARQERILETAFLIFADQGIDGVTMNQIADACGIGIATLYRNYNTKTDLVMAVSAKFWRDYIESYDVRDDDEITGADDYEIFLDSFLDMYRNDRNLLRFNQYFNMYIEKEHIKAEQMKGFMDVVKMTSQRFHKAYAKGIEDGTLKTDFTEQEIFSASLHLMLAAVTRYAVGLVFNNGNDPMKELELLKRMLINEYTA
ncbi:MAG: TetR/AcrR family transcriptional regulator [Eubacterium sp.]|nr:TetR/AcrR family transcriptional regulator [Eubacterium sp.]